MEKSNKEIVDEWLAKASREDMVDLITWVTNKSLSATVMAVQYVRKYEGG